MLFKMTHAFTIYKNKRGLLTAHFTDEA